MKKKKMNEENSQVEEKEEVLTEPQNTKEEEKETPSPLDEMTAKYEETNDKYLRLYSEFDNFRKRTQKEKLELYKTAAEEVMLSLLPVMDDFERAEKSMEGSEDVKSMKEGFSLIRQKLINTLEQKGLKSMESAVGKPFDLEVHEAITKIKAPSAKMKGKVIDEVEKGYKLHDKVIRFSKVVIGE